MRKISKTIWLIVIILLSFLFPDDDGFIASQAEAAGKIPNIVGVNDQRFFSVENSREDQSRGQLLAAKTYPVQAPGTTTHAITVADFNKDGHMDTAVCNRNGGTVDVFLRVADPILPYDFVGTSIAIGGAGQFHAIGSGDFDKDGLADLVVVSASGALYIYRNDPQNLGKSFKPFNPNDHYAAGSYSHDVVVADFDQDGKLDFAVANAGTGVPVFVFYGNGDGSFVPEEINVTLPGGHPENIVVGDFNVDGLPDWGIDSTGGNHSSLVLLINENGTFLPGNAIKVDLGETGYITAMTAGDFFADQWQIPDFAVSLGNDDNARLVMVEAGNFPDPKAANPLDSFTVYPARSWSLDILLQQTFPSLTPWDFKSADFNNDGNVDLSLSYWDRNNESGVMILQGDGRGNLSYLSQSSTGVNAGGSYQSMHEVYWDDDLSNAKCSDFVHADAFCNDGIPCTQDVCSQGQCMHNPDDGLCSGLNNECRTGYCDLSLGCQGQPDNEGSPCEVGSFCNLNATCQSGLCVGTPRDCSDPYVCTEDRCDENNNNCVNIPRNNLCPLSDNSCLYVQCVPKDATADPTTGCITKNKDDGTPCKDDLFCTVDEKCSNGQCIPSGQVTCSDGFACTIDRCDEVQASCVHDDTQCLLACSDHRDNDGNNRIDMNDERCEVPDDDDELVKWFFKFESPTGGDLDFLEKPVLGNFDQDPSLEVAVVGEAQNEGYYFIVNEDGTLLRSETFINTPQFSFGNRRQIASDLDRDGLDDLIVTTTGDPDVTHNVYIIKGSGEVLQFNPQNGLTGWEQGFDYGLAAGNFIPETPQKEVIAATSDTIYVLDHNANLIWQWQRDPKSPLYLSKIRLADINKDHLLEIIAVLGNGRSTRADENQLVVIDHNQQVKVFPLDLGDNPIPVIFDIAVGDMNNDTQLDLVVLATFYINNPNPGVRGPILIKKSFVVYTFETDHFTKLNEFNIPDFAIDIDDFSLGDLNGDGRLDIVAADGSLRNFNSDHLTSGVIAFDNSGNILWHNPLIDYVSPYTTTVGPGTPSLADIDGDGKDEVFVNLSFFDPSRDALPPRFYILDDDGSELSVMQERYFEFLNTVTQRPDRTWLGFSPVIGYLGNEERPGIIEHLLGQTATGAFTSEIFSAIYHFDHIIHPKDKPYPSWRMAYGGALIHNRAGACEDDRDCNIGQPRFKGTCINYACQYGTSFKRGDVDGSGKVDISDPIGLLKHLFLGGAEPPCKEAANAEDDDKLDITDAIAILGNLFLGKGPLAEPFNHCGVDPAGQGGNLGCASYPVSSCGP